MTETIPYQRAREMADRGPRPAPKNPGYATPRLETIAPPSLQGQPVPERRWQVNGWIPQGYVTMLGGDGGVGKSLLAQQLLTCAASGRAWLGQETKRCRVVGIFCEDDPEELHRRQAAINAYLGLEFSDLEDLVYVSRVGQENSLMIFGRWEEPGGPTEFFQQIHNLTQDFGAELLVLDSLHDLFAGNENSRPQARQFVNLLAGLARDMGDRSGTVVLTAHPSLQGIQSGSGASGSTGWNNAVRSRLYLTRPQSDEGDTDDDERVLSRKKANYTRRSDELRLQWRDGVIVPIEEPSGFLGAIEHRSAEGVFLALLQEREKQGRPVSHKNRAGNYAPKEFARNPHRLGFDRRQFERAMESLFSDGRIRVVDYGRTHDQRQKIVPVEAEDGAL